jgi:hypothetical protein
MARSQTRAGPSMSHPRASFRPPPRSASGWPRTITRLPAAAAAWPPAARTGPRVGSLGLRIGSDGTGDGLGTAGRMPAGRLARMPALRSWSAATAIQASGHDDRESRRAGRMPFRSRRLGWRRLRRLGAENLAANAAVSVRWNHTGPGRRSGRSER